tara:strand:- start:221 stop:388 length:168 start_codon:yes stop_codon:yes gene_type:complete
MNQVIGLERWCIVKIQGGEKYKKPMRPPFTKDELITKYLASNKLQKMNRFELNIK